MVMVSKTSAMQDLKKRHVEQIEVRIKHVDLGLKVKIKMDVIESGQHLQPGGREHGQQRQ